MWVLRRLEEDAYVNQPPDQVKSPSICVSNCVRVNINSVSKLVSEAANRKLAASR